MTDKPGIAARAERQRERIQQDRLARAGFPGQHGHAALELEVEAVDQDDVANREARQHGRIQAQAGRHRKGAVAVKTVLSGRTGRRRPKCAVRLRRD